MMLLQVLTLACLGLICYQDMRYRAVYWICFPVLAGILFFIKQDYAGIPGALTDAVIAMLFFGIQVLLIWAYFSIKNKKVVNLTASYLGLGDILFLTAIAFYLSPVNYILFYVGSLFAVLAYTLMNTYFNKKAGQEIPLAGLQALLLGCLLVFSMTCTDLKLYTDSWTYGL